MNNTCRSCGAKIKWIRMKSGKLMPVDPQFITHGNDCWDVFGRRQAVLITPDGDTIRTPMHSDDGYVPHWATCPQADQHRKERKK